MYPNLFLITNCGRITLDFYNGKVHIYRSGEAYSKWTPTSTIVSPFFDANFGYSVALSGDGRLVVGANSVATYTGQVFVYALQDGTEEWELEATLNSPLGEAQGYGYRVAIDGETIVVGNAVNQAYIYQYNADTAVWQLNSSLTCPDGDANAQGLGPYFGRAAAISGDYVVVGAHNAGANVLRIAMFTFL